MIAERLEYVKFQTVIKRLLFIVGLWTKDDSSILFRSLFHIYLSFFIVPTIGVINFFLTNITNINLATKSLSTLLGFSTGICFIINRNDVDELHAILDPYFDELLKTPELSKIVLKKISTFRRLPTFITTFITVVCISYAIVPIISILAQIRHKIWPINYNLIYLTAYPWEVPKHSFMYSIHFIDEYLLTIAIVLITSSADSLYTYYIFQIIGMLREISYQISTFDEKSSEFIIRQCVNKYEILVHCTEKIEKVYGVIILWTMNVNAIVLCAVIFQLSHAKSIPFVSMVLFVAHAGLKLTQVFIFAWGGSLLTTESEKFRDTIYASRWLGNNRLKSSIIIMLSQKPLILTACSLLNVTIDMFVKVGNTTISYYLLLKTFEQGA
ncbi:GSCOCT00013821001.3-RA-CDS [Cotesia congregata]|uniref:Odorant receptor n=1 Tax=Cotesia congregata TaxID=51543 RepID=A0A8J2MTT7_COTCN|nr:GSCOCT00013821001.3-RA-CDS [Cotesia congregata]CAG5109161.1 olfactory receptor 105 [Cotesia congregata]